MCKIFWVKLYFVDVVLGGDSEIWVATRGQAFVRFMATKATSSSVT